MLYKLNDFVTTFHTLQEKMQFSFQRSTQEHDMYFPCTVFVCVVV